MSAAIDDPAWPAAAVARLTELWLQPHLTAGDIGRIMHRSKNAVVAKANRLNLPARPSPIKPAAAPAVVLTPWQRARKEAGESPLAASHPIALAVMEGR